MRHEIKPLAYLRYGDDFVMFMSREQAHEAQNTAEKWLDEALRLPVHPTNDVVAETKHGLFFLGHTIYPYSPLSVEARMYKKIIANVDMRTIASYKAMHVPRRKAALLPWLLR